MVEFDATIWVYSGESAWHFISLPKKVAEEVRAKNSGPRRGWGSIPVMVTIGATTWKTSIFPSKEYGTFLLPLKAQVRKREEIGEGSKIHLKLEFTYDNNF